MIQHTDWLFGWSWILWIGFLVLMFSSIGNWGYTYRVHRRYGGQPGVSNNALDILDEGYARGDVKREQYLEMKADLLRD